jgi:dynein heavy chain 1
MPKAKNSNPTVQPSAKKLDTRPVYDAWLHDINRRDMGVNGRLFKIVCLRGGGFQLAVNFIS